MLADLMLVMIGVRGTVPMGLRLGGDVPRKDPIEDPDVKVVGTVEPDDGYPDVEYDVGDDDVDVRTRILQIPLRVQSLLLVLRTILRGPLSLDVPFGAPMEDPVVEVGAFRPDDGYPRDECF